jgi:hypothetical protein
MESSNNLTLVQPDGTGITVVNVQPSSTVNLNINETKLSATIVLSPISSQTSLCPYHT